MTGGSHTVSMIDHPYAIVCLVVFSLSYVAVLFEELTHIRKSKPVLLGAGIIWVIIALMAREAGISSDVLHQAVTHSLTEYAALMLFLLSAMTFINMLQERLVFEALRVKLVRADLNKRMLFWVTGLLAFFLSPLADNMTTALVMGAVVLAVGGKDSRFITLGCINVVGAANAGGAFSPFGDITTLMVWQAGKLSFFKFFTLFLPSAVNYIVPALIMSFFVSKEKPAPAAQTAKMKPGARRTIALGLFTIALAIVFEQVLGLPAYLGMMTGLALLMLLSWYLQRHRNEKDFDIINMVSQAEWDTLLFFFGIIFSVGGLSFIGWLEYASHFMYDGWGPSAANISIGVASAAFDNIPLMFAVLSMNPVMDHFQWLLITLTTGVGGSLLSIGSAAGVALMGTARGHYTFMAHLKWTPVIALGYAASIAVHFLLNG